MFSGFVASPPPVGNNAVYFLLLSFFAPYVYTVMPFSVILGVGLTAPQFWPGIWHWWITVFFSSTVLYMLPLTSMLVCVSEIATGYETGIPYGFLGDSLALFGTIISSLK